jgi:hypothetical protein
MRYIKLQQPPRSRERVREVAKDVGVSARQLLDVLRQLGEFLPSAAGYIEAPVIRKVHDYYGVTYDTLPPVPGKDAAPPSLAGGLRPPAKRKRRENHPLMNDPSRFRDQGPDATYAWDRPGAARKPPGRWDSLSVEQRWAQATDGDASSAFEFEEWKLRGFNEVERDVWMAAGLRASQAKWAAELRDGGLLPADLQTNLHGWKVIDRLQRGEGARAVARLLNAMRNSDAG